MIVHQYSIYYKYSRFFEDMLGFLPMIHITTTVRSPS